MEAVAGCDRSGLCHEFAGDHDTEFRRTYPAGPASRVVFSRGNYAAVVDLSPMIAGHCLIAPRDHQLSFASILKRDGGAFHQFLDEFTQRYKQHYPTYSIVEHGSTAATNPANCVAHAHLHVVPIACQQLRDGMLRDNFTFVELADLADLAEFQDATKPYYLLGGSECEWSIAADDSPRPKQYFRILLGRILGYEEVECDWALVIRRPLFHQSMQLLSTDATAGHQ